MKSIFKFVIAAVTQQVASKSSGVDYDAMTNWYAGTEPENVVYAVTCGSEEPLVDVAGILLCWSRVLSVRSLRRRLQQEALERAKHSGLLDWTLE